MSFAAARRLARRKEERKRYRENVELRQDVKALMELQWQAKGVRKPIDKVQWTLPALTEDQQS